MSISYNNNLYTTNASKNTTFERTDNFIIGLVCLKKAQICRLFNAKAIHVKEQMVVLL